MKAEISHHGFTGEESYSGVYLQQGTMITGGERGGRGGRGVL